MQRLKPLMLAGTGSDVAKSVFVTASGRIFKQDGYLWRVGTQHARTLFIIRTMQYDLLADHVRRHVDVPAVCRFINCQ